ncbi:MAG TPA: histidine kinase [Terriglobales bacterium]|nr:histidine kinase [Terriglobales bacterium]
MRSWLTHGKPMRRRLARLLVCGSLTLAGLTFLNGCDASRTDKTVTKPVVEFTSVPTGDRRDVLGDPTRVYTIKGRVIGAQPGEQIVLYAHALNESGQMTWYVQPLVLEPFTRIRANSTWGNIIHPGAEYAALLVEPGFRPHTVLSLPTQGVVASATTQPWPPVWQSWWFPLACVFTAALLTLAFYRVWSFQVTRKLNLRFEERLAERTRVAQELHDTLLQGVLSASMQLHIALDQLPESSPARPGLNRVLQLMGHVVDEGRNTLRGLRSSIENPQDLKNSFSRIPEELGMQEKVDFRVVVEGPTMPLRSAVRDDVYSIGREALVNAFRHSEASRIDMELDYAPDVLRIVVRDDGHGIDAKVIETGRDGHWGLSGMRERAGRIGARLRVMSRVGAGTEVELRVPGEVAFESESSSSSSWWFAGFYHRRSKKSNAATGVNGRV